MFNKQCPRPGFGCIEYMCGSCEDGLCTEGLSKGVEVRGYMDDGWCPSCISPLNDLVNRCPYCGQLLNWSTWKRCNLKEGYNNGEED